MNIPFFIYLLIGNGGDKGMEIPDPCEIAVIDIAVVQVLIKCKHNRIERRQDISHGESLLTGMIDCIKTIRRISAQIMFFIPETRPQPRIDSLIEYNAPVRILSHGIAIGIQILSVSRKETEVGLGP